MMITSPEAELPFYFGNDAELFGLFHAAGGPARRAVLLCPPLGQDYIRCHRLYRQLANALAGEGIPALRFDYYGTGDSAGESADIDWNRCIADIATAADELRRRSGAERVIAFGARLGGSMATAAAAVARFAGLVTWDPVLDGGAYVSRLDAMQSALGQDRQRFVRPRSAADVAAQWLGFATSERLRRQISELRLDPSTVPTLLLDSLGGISDSGWRDASNTKVEMLEPPAPWDDLNRLEVAILSHPLIQTVTSHVRAAA
jgi:alpha-beta hydrolase superfamily lysophospholipase